MKLLFLLLIVLQSLPTTLLYKKNYDDTSWRTGSLQLMGTLQDFVPVDNPRQQWTKDGSYKHLRVDSTGFFYVKKINDRWWLINPDGYAQIGRAVNSMPGKNVLTNYDLIHRLGFNQAANFITPEDQTRDTYNTQRDSIMSYSRRVPIYQCYRSVRHKYYATSSSVKDQKNSYVWVLDPAFAHACDSIVNIYVKSYVNDRNMIGWFTDNEIPFNQSQLQLLVRDLKTSDPSRKAALKWAADHGLTENDCIHYTAAVTEDLQQQFAGYLAETYFRIVQEAIHKVDTNHLILGSRLHGNCRRNRYVVSASHQYTDVTSVNFYDKYDPNEQIAQTSWTQDHPCLVGEFYMKDIHVQDTVQSGAGWYVNSQSERGQWYQHVVLQLIESKCYVAWHYFRFRDDDNGSNKGLVDLNNQEYRDYTCWIHEINDQVYPLVEYFDQTQPTATDRPTSSTEATKFISDGRLLIQSDNIVYDTLGQIIK